MSEGRPVLIIGAPVRAGEPPPIRGTRMIECQRCKAPTYFSPFSLTRPEAKTGEFICYPCAMKIEGPVEIGAITPEQIRELIEALEEDP